MKRSEHTRRPSGATSSTGPSTSTGPPGTTRTTRGSRSAPVGTDHHQFLGAAAGLEQAGRLEPIGVGGHDRAEADDPGGHGGGEEAGVAEHPGGAGRDGEL